MNDLMLVLGWGSPIGIGIFLLCLAGMIFILSRVDKKEKRISFSNKAIELLNLNISGSVPVDGLLASALGDEAMHMILYQVFKIRLSQV